MTIYHSRARTRVNLHHSSLLPVDVVANNSTCFENTNYEDKKIEFMVLTSTRPVAPHIDGCIWIILIHLYDIDS